MSDKFYGVHFQSVASEIHMVAIFSTEEKAKEYAIHLRRQATARRYQPYKFEIKNFVANIFVDEYKLPQHYEDLELVYVNDDVPKYYKHNK